MGTRSIIEVKDEQDNVLMTMYQQYDGYLDGVGKDLCNFLHGMQIVNGIGLNDDRRIANGLCCLSAQLVAFFKVGVGGTYLMPPGQSEEYNYTVTAPKNKTHGGGFVGEGSALIVDVTDESGGKIFHGTVKSLLKRIAKEEKAA